MTYQTRMCAATAVATAVHILFALVPWDHGYSNRLGNAEQVSEPVIMELQQPQQSPKRLVDITAPTEDPLDTLTDLIAEANARASDMAERDSGADAPQLEAISEAEQLAAPKPSAPPQPPPAPPSPPQPEETAPEEVDEPRTQLAELIQERDRLEEELAKMLPSSAAEEAAQSPNAPADDLPEGVSRGKSSPGVSGGFVNNEARRHEFAPYLKVLSNRVERRWKQAIMLRYSGATRRKAVLNCVIAPDGRIVDVTIEDSGGSGTYAALCKQAVLAAGPFPPFPFEVPPGYRSKNIEIRWTFHFL